MVNSTHLLMFTFTNLTHLKTSGTQFGKFLDKHFVAWGIYVAGPWDQTIGCYDNTMIGMSWARCWFATCRRVRFRLERRTTSQFIKFTGTKGKKETSTKSPSQCWCLVWFKEWKICDIFIVISQQRISILDLSILCRSRTLFTFLNVEVSVSNKDYLSLENVCVCL